jgi:hypothetical protein
MPDYTTYRDGTPIARASGSNAAGFPATTVFEAEYDASRRAAVAADTIEVLNIPKGTFVHKVFVKVLSGQSGQTMSVQDDAGTPILFVTAQDVATTGTVAMGTTTAAGKFFPTGGKLRILVPSTMSYTTLRVKIMVEATVVG